MSDSLSFGASFALVDDELEASGEGVSPTIYVSVCGLQIMFFKWNTAAFL